MPNPQIKTITADGVTYDIVDKTSGYAPLDSPALTGTPTAPTAVSGTDTTQIATTAFVQTKVSDINSTVSSLATDVAAKPSLEGTTVPVMNGTAAVGTATTASKSDHVHPTDTTRQGVNLYFENKSASSWTRQSSPTYSGYSYRCAVACTGVTSSMYADVIFNPAQAISGDYAPVCQTYNGGVYIYSKVNTSITIPTIVVMK